MKIEMRGSKSLDYYTKAVMFYEWTKAYGQEDYEGLAEMHKSMEAMLMEGPDHITLHLFFKDKCLRYMEGWTEKFCTAIRGTAASWLSDASKWPTEKPINVIVNKRSKQADIYDFYDD